VGEGFGLDFDVFSYTFSKQSIGPRHIYWDEHGRKWELLSIIYFLTLAKPKDGKRINAYKL